MPNERDTPIRIQLESGTIVHMTQREIDEGTLEDANNTSYAEASKKRFTAEQLDDRNYNAAFIPLILLKWSFFLQKAYLSVKSNLIFRTIYILAAMALGVFIAFFINTPVLISFFVIGIMCVLIAKMKKMDNLLLIFDMVVTNALYPVIITYVVSLLPAALLSPAVTAILAPILFWGMIAFPVVLLLLGLAKEYLFKKGLFIDFFDNPLYQLATITLLLVGLMFEGIAVVGRAGCRLCFPPAPPVAPSLLPAYSRLPTPASSAHNASQGKFSAPYSPAIPSFTVTDLSGAVEELVDELELDSGRTP